MYCHKLRWLSKVCKLNNYHQMNLNIWESVLPENNLKVTWRHHSLSEMFSHISQDTTSSSSSSTSSFLSCMPILCKTVLRPLPNPSHVISPLLSTPQLNCSRVLSPGQAQASQPPADSPHWLLCAEDWLFPVADGPCVAYSFRCASMSLILCACVCARSCDAYAFISLADLK